MDKRNKIYHILYTVMILTFLLILISCAINYNGPTPRQELSNGYINKENAWTLADGSAADTGHLNELPGVTPKQEYSIYLTLPSKLAQGVSLNFRSKNIFYKVYIDGVLRYEPYVEDSIFYTKSYGTRWCFVPLYEDDAGKTVELRFSSVYSSSRACIDNTVINTSASMILTILQEKSVALITCILLLFVGLLLIIADIPINIQSEKNHELMYLGLFAVSIAVWCLSETNLIQLFTGDSRIMQIVSCYSLMLIPIPMVLYLDSAFGFRRRIIVPVITWLSFAEYIICTILHFTKILDYRETLKATHIMLVVSAVTLLATIIKNAFMVGKNQIKNVYRVLRGIGLMGLAFATGIDLWRFYRGSSTDSAMFVRIGLLIFIICYGSSSLEKTINAVRLGVRAEFVSQLAYKDGLTGIGNRTSFQEHLVELEKIKLTGPSIGIVMFDVNDLKYVNDNLGHSLGDSMLVESAKIIKNAFDTVNASCYRIGGDEFAAVLCGEDAKALYEQGITQFFDAIHKYNQNPTFPFRISIAHGCAIYDTNQPETKLLNLYEQADAYMYKNKKEIKSKELPPAEYYKAQ